MPAVLLVVVAALSTTSCGSHGEADPSASGATSRTDAGAPSPGASTVAVLRRDFQIIYRLDAETAEGARVPLNDQSVLQVETNITDGALVTAGDVVGRLAVVPDVRAELGAEAREGSRISADRLRQVVSLERKLVAPVTGRLRDAGPSIAPGIESVGVDVLAQLTPIQQLRYQSMPFSAEAVVETVMGRRTVPCSALWVDTDAAHSAPVESGSSMDASSGATLHCRLPAQVETVAGLRASLTATSTRLRGATVVPNSAIRFDAETKGFMVDIMEGGKRRGTPISVGATDGIVRVVTSPLSIGAPLAVQQGVQ